LGQRVHRADLALDHDLRVCPQSGCSMLGDQYGERKLAVGKRLLQTGKQGADVGSDAALPNMPGVEQKIDVLARGRTSHGYVERPSNCGSKSGLSHIRFSVSS